jgi:heme oxygenase (biliverdin-producing, ferredoxin)
MDWQCLDRNLQRGRMFGNDDIAGRSRCPVSLSSALRERTRDLHVQAERSGMIADIVAGRATQAGYALLLRNFLPVYEALEQHLSRHAASPVVGSIVRPELARASAIEADLNALSAEAYAAPVLPAAVSYVQAIELASAGDGARLIAHAYTRYLGDLSGGQIVKRLLARSLSLSASALSFYEFPAIADVARFKSEYRAAIDRAGDGSDDFDGIVEEGALAFALNIQLSAALQAEAARRAF